MTLQSKQDKRVEDLKTLSIAISTQSRLPAEAAHTLLNKNYLRKNLLKTRSKDVCTTSTLFWHSTNFPVPGWAGLSSAATPHAGTWSSSLCSAASGKPKDVWSRPVEHCLPKLSQQHHDSHN